MKQVVFAVLLMAMASLTGCLNTDDTSVDENTDTTSDNNDGLIDPVEVTGYTPPENSDVRVDNGYSGHWIETNPDSSYFEWIACSKQGYSIKIRADRDPLYCDLDERQDIGAQTWVNKTGNTVTVECIKDIQGKISYVCKDAYASSNDYTLLGAHILFTSVEGFQEKTFVTLSQTSRTGNPYDFNHQFFKTEIELKFEPVSFTISEYAFSSYSSGGTLDDDTQYAYNMHAGTSTTILDSAFDPTYSSTRYF
jgi:hypothetical protein